MFVYGKNQVEELLRYNGKIKTLYIAHTFVPKGIIKEFIEKNPKVVKKVEQKEIEKIAQNRKARDIVAILSEFEYENPYDLVDKAISEHGILLYLDHIEDPVNLGAIIRSAAAFEAKGIIIPKDRACRITPTVIRVSEGFAFKIPLAMITNPMNFIKEAKKHGLFVASLERGGHPLNKTSFPKPLLLVAGSEGKGVSRKILEHSDIIISIEQSKDVNSLNVHVAVSIALWKAFTENQESSQKK